MERSKHGKNYGELYLRDSCSLVVSILLSSMSSHLLLFNDLLQINGVPLLLQSDIVGEASDDGARQPFCMDAVFVAAANAFCGEMLVDDNCSFNVLTSFSANVALCEKWENERQTYTLLCVPP